MIELNGKLPKSMTIIASVLGEKNYLGKLLQVIQKRKKKND